MSLRVAITTLGCKTNQFESAAMIESLEREGFSVVPFDSVADVYLINTCTVTARTDAESRKLIRRVKRRNPEARVVVTGCYAQVSPEQLAAMSEVGLIIGNEEKRRLAELLKSKSTSQRVIVADIGKSSKAEPLQLESFAEHTRAFLQIQNGCDSFCSYCIVPYARGRSRSVMPADVLDEIGLLARKGFKEIVLTGIHLGNYGRDLAPSSSLLSLLMEIERQALTARLRIGSLDPQDISPEFMELVAKSRTICPHLHIPLQSGSGSVLARMNRQYDGAFIRELVHRLVASLPDVCIGFDVIAGFPGETDEEFSDTVKLIEELPVSYLHVFPFSSRPGTKAASMPGHLQGRVVTERAAVLRKLGEEKWSVYERSFIGKELELLFMHPIGNGAFRGLSRNYLDVHVESDRALENSVQLITVTGVVDGRITGRISP